MCEIRPEAHIQCKVCSEASIMPGVSALIQEPVPKEWGSISGTADMTISGNDMVFTLPTSKVPRVVFFYGRTSESYKSGTTEYYQMIAFGYHCDMQTKKIDGVYARTQRTRYSGSSSYSYSYNTYLVSEKDYEFSVNDDGTIKMIVPRGGTYLSYLKGGVSVTYHAYE